MSFSLSQRYTTTDPWTKLTESHSSKTSDTVKSLTSGTKYYFQVQVFDSQGSVIAIYQGSVTTLSTPLSLAPPQSPLKYSNVTQNSVNLSWRPAQVCSLVFLNYFVCNISNIKPFFYFFVLFDKNFLQCLIRI